MSDFSSKLTDLIIVWFAPVFAFVVFVAFVVWFVMGIRQYRRERQERLARQVRGLDEPQKKADLPLLPIMAGIGKLFAVQISIAVFALAPFALLRFYASHGRFSLMGITELLAASSFVWLWICWRSKDQALRTLVTLLLYSTIYFFLFLGVSLLAHIAHSLMEMHADSIAAWHVIVLLATAAILWYLRAVAVRRNKKKDVA